MMPLGASLIPLPSTINISAPRSYVRNFIEASTHVNRAEQMALFKNLHCLLLFLNRIFNADGPGRVSGKAEGVRQSRPTGAETRRRSVRGLGQGRVSFHGSSLGLRWGWKPSCNIDAVG